MGTVDIAIPCYQHGRFLRDCVSSVLNQGIDGLRVLIIDNASTDGSADIAHQLSREDPRVHVVVHTTNLGPHASFNEAVDWASADYFMILCSDDLLMQGSLARMVTILDARPGASFAYGRDLHWNGLGALPDLSETSADTGWKLRDGRDFIHAYCRSPEQYVATGMILVRTSVQKAAGHYRPELPHTDDVEMLLRLARLGSVAETDGVVGIKRMHGDNRTQDLLSERTRNLLELLAAFESFFEREGQSLLEADRLMRLARRGVSERAYWCAVKDLVRARMRNAWGMFGLAVRLYPRVAIVPPLNYLFRMDRSIMESFR
jgi:glycosyltransferase involved in cell wall biosynthesis